MTATDRLQGIETSVALKAPCRVATVGNLTLSGLQTLNGLTLAARDRVLVRAQTDSSENGIYTAAAGLWVRALDFNGSRDAVHGTLVHVTDGTTYGGHFFRLSASNPVTIGTDDLAWVDLGPMPFDGDPFTPEQYGAMGDGVTNDTAAFHALAAAVNTAGGGMILFRPGVTYIVGAQTVHTSGSVWAYEPTTLLAFDGLAKPLILVGNGCTIKCAADLRYGTFDPATGLETVHSQPYLGSGERATPYEQLIRIWDCTGAISITGFNLDGNVDGLNIGGPFGDTGYQLQHTAIWLADNTGGEYVSDCELHHHGLDGLIVDGVSPDIAQEGTGNTFVNVHCHHNGRQGMSVVGGTGYSFLTCRFNYTGTDIAIASSPGAGVDFEAEGGKKVRDFTFTRCEFIGNFNTGIVADQGDNANVSFRDCRFIGATGWAAWPQMPRFKFENCTFVGPLVNAYPSTDPDLATQFINCRFLDDTALSPTGTVYAGSNPDKPIIDFGVDDTNVRFKGCAFVCTDAHCLPYTLSAAIYEDCYMSQTGSTTDAFPRGVYRGASVITSSGTVSVNSSYQGRVTINGTELPTTLPYVNYGGFRYRGVRSGSDVTLRVSGYDNPGNFGNLQVASTIGDRVLNSGTPARGGVSEWICHTSPGSTTSHWHPVGIIGALQSTSVTLSTTGATVDTEARAAITSILTSLKNSVLMSTA